MPHFEKFLQNARYLTPSYSNDSEPRTHPLKKQYCLIRYLSNNASHYRTREHDSVAGRRLFIGSYYRTGECDSKAISDLIQSLRPARQCLRHHRRWQAGERSDVRISNMTTILKTSNTKVTIYHQGKWQILPINFLLKKLKVATKSADIILKA